jgi:hypothetical protein
MATAGNMTVDGWHDIVDKHDKDISVPTDGEKSFLSLVQDKTISDHYSVVIGVPEFEAYYINM